jgi:hypothetical protein
MKQLKNEAGHYDVELRDELAGRLKRYPTVLILCWSVATAYRTV